MPVYTPGFNHFLNASKQLVRTVFGQNPELPRALEALFASAKNCTEEQFQAKMKPIFAHCANRIDQYWLNNPMDAIFQEVESLFQSFATQIQAEDPFLAAKLREICNAPNGSEKGKKLLAQLRGIDSDTGQPDGEFVNAFSAYLKKGLTPTTLSRAEHMDSIRDQVFKDTESDNRQRASQAIYDPERNFIRELFRLLFAIVEMVAEPGPRTAAKADDKTPERDIRLIPAG